jgi:hypothetical protein
MRSAGGPVAILDGRPAGPGDRVGAYRVELVDADRVVLSRDGRSFELVLDRQ